jgi:hypothetical protein
VSGGFGGAARQNVMRTVIPAVLGLVLGGCSITTQPQGLGYGQYAGFSCAELTEEAQRLVRVVADRSEHLLEDDAARRGAAFTQLRAARKAMAVKNC